MSLQQAYIKSSCYQHTIRERRNKHTKTTPTQYTNIMDALLHNRSRRGCLLNWITSYIRPHMIFRLLCCFFLIHKHFLLRWVIDLQRNFHVKCIQALLGTACTRPCQNTSKTYYIVAFLSRNCAAKFPLLLHVCIFNIVQVCIIIYFGIIVCAK